MIELNLLPEELKPRKKSSMQLGVFPIVQVFIGIIFILVVSHVLAIYLVSVNKKSLVALNKEWDSYAPKRKELDDLRAELKDIDIKVKTIEDLTRKRVLWAKKLNALSDSVPGTIWLSGLSYDKKSASSSLILEGYTTGMEKEVGVFMGELEKNKDFSGDMRDIVLGFTKTAKIDNREVTNFRLKCEFRQEE